MGRGQELRRELERIQMGEEGPGTPTIFLLLLLVTCLFEESFAYDSSFLSYCM